VDFCDSELSDEKRFISNLVTNRVPIFSPVEKVSFEQIKAVVNYSFELKNLHLIRSRFMT
jgi:hypothetical protein